jgi:L-fuconolactonase
MLAPRVYRLRSSSLPKSCRSWRQDLRYAGGGNSHCRCIRIQCAASKAEIGARHPVNGPGHTEEILDPSLPIVDPHHHLWFRPAAFLDFLEQQHHSMVRLLLPTFRRHSRYLLDEFLADLRGGHDVRATVYVEVHSMYKKGGPEQLQSVGEVEFANGMAAMAASGLFGDIAICAGIVGSVDLRLGDAVRDVLEAHIRAGGGRYRGIRAKGVVYDADPSILGSFAGAPHLMRDARFRAGFKHLAQLGLSYDAWQLEYQLPELVDLARDFPDTTIIVNHLGGLIGVEAYAGRQEQRFSHWSENIRALACCPNVSMKLGGLGMPTCGLPTSFATTPPTSEQLAADWRPYIERCIEAFGVDRCMFESNYPVDGATAGYAVIWNTFKRIAGGASRSEKAALFSETAKRVYRIDS